MTPPAAPAHLLIDAPLFGSATASEPVTLDAVVRALRALRVAGLADEYRLHGAIAEALGAARLPFAREVVLGPRARIDVVVNPEGAPRIGIEAKKGKPNAENLRAQATRYLTLAAQPGAPMPLDALVLVVEQSVSRLPATFAVTVGDRVLPVVLVTCSKLWGLSL